jgi:hypothetical protein
VSVTPGSLVQELLLTVPSIIEMPVTPAVRAAWYEMLAGLPDVENLGTITDVNGQQGQAIADTADYRGCGEQPCLEHVSYTSLPAGRRGLDGARRPVLLRDLPDPVLDEPEPA